MKMYPIPHSDLVVSNIVMGCMRIDQLSPVQTEELVRSALEEGVNFFDHADIYGGNHACEEHFSKSVQMTPSLREKMILQTKCGIGPGYYDFSKEHIVEAAEASLKALRTEYLDVLLLHRPDALMDPDEVAEAFQALHSAGKVRYFGVSNHNPMQMELLQKAIPQKLLFNQLQISVTHCPVIDSGLTVNMQGEDQSINREGSILEYCRLHDVTIQAWSPFQKAFFNGTFVGDRGEYPELNDQLEALAQKYGVTPEGIAVAWLTRHPAHMQVIVGTTKASRLRACCAGSEIPLTRPEWYGLYRAAKHIIP